MWKDYICVIILGVSKGFSGYKYSHIKSTIKRNLIFSYTLAYQKFSYSFKFAHSIRGFYCQENQLKCTMWIEILINLLGPYFGEIFEFLHFMRCEIN